MVQSEQKTTSYTVKGLQMAIVNDAKIKELRNKMVSFKLSDRLSNDIQEITQCNQKSNNKNEI